MGQKGALTLEPAFSYADIQMAGQIDGDMVTYQDKQPFPNKFVREADHFSSCVLEDRQPGPSGGEGLCDMEWIDRIYKSAAMHG